MTSLLLVDSNEVFELSDVLRDFHYYYEPGGNPQLLLNQTTSLYITSLATNYTHITKLHEQGTHKSQLARNVCSISPANSTKM